MDISSMLEVQVDEVKEVDSKENVTPKDLNPSVTAVLPPVSSEERNYYKLVFSNDISTVRFRRIHCTACDIHIGSAPAQAHNMLEHPVLRTLLCAKCREFYGDGTFEQGDDATDMFCRWCANGGNLYCCSYCSNTFCYKCIKRNFDSVVRKKIEADEKWKCFVCDPTDLYSARALCWALLQHVQTMTRLLQSDRIMSAEEVDERMNLDESKCCPRRKKRKRRKTESNSEEEDETYDPNANDEPMMAKRKPLKRRYKHRRKSISNGTVPPLVPIIQSSASLENVSNTSEGSTSLSSVEQMKINNVSTISSSAFISPVLKEQKDTKLPSQCESDTVETGNPSVVQTTLYNSTINAVPTVKLLQSTAAFKPMHSMLTPRIQNPKNSYQPTYYSTTRMVTIPNPKRPLTLTRPRVLLPKPRKMVQMLVTPSIIDLDSDSDEPTVVQSMNSPHAPSTPINENIKININSPSTVAVPVALVSKDNSCNNDKIKMNEIEDQPPRELCSRQNKDEKNFSQVVLHPHKEDFNDILSRLQVKFNQILKDSQNTEISRSNIQAARSKIRCLYREICNTVTQLAYFNDRIIRKYSSWEKSHNAKDEITRNITKRISTLDENNKIPLDMTCINDSATDSENEDNLITLSPSKLIASTNVFEVFSKKKDMVSHGVGNSSILCEDKSVQVYTTEARNYKEVIGYSKSKIDHGSVTDNNILEPVTMANQHLGKYQEQFISYLQHIEDHGTTLDNTSNDDVLESCTDVEMDSYTTETIAKELPFTAFDVLPKPLENHVEECTTGTVNDVPDTELPSSVFKSETDSNVSRIAETSTNDKNVNKNVEEKSVKLKSSAQSEEKQDSNIKKKTLIGIKSLFSNDGKCNENLCNAVIEDDCTIIED